jgi:hypothetical protein
MGTVSSIEEKKWKSGILVLFFFHLGRGKSQATHGIFFYVKY